MMARVPAHSRARSFRPGPSPYRRRLRSRGASFTLWLAGGLAGAAICLASAGQAMANEAAEQVAATPAVEPAPSAKAKPARHPRANTYLKRKWGVEVVYVRQTAGGYMLEFRYKVLDAEKAKPLFERQTKPLLTHAESGASLVVPTPAKTGALRNSNPPIAGTTYWMFFANPGKLVKRGEHVSVAIGDFVAKDLVVQ